MRYLLVLLCIYGGACHAAVLSDSERERLVSQALQQFWGRAIQANGQFIQPSSEAERNTVPVSKTIVNRAFDVGEISGLGQWCGLDWEANYFALTKSARNKGLSDTQVAFISFLHGAAQGRISSAMEKTSPCNEGERSKVRQMLEKSKARGLNGV